MLNRMTVAIIATGFVATVSGAIPALAQPRDMKSQNKAAQDCITKGGWYQRDTGVCELEASAKQAATQKDEQTCKAKGGWLQRGTGVCEVETKAKAKN